MASDTGAGVDRPQMPCTVEDLYRSFRERLRGFVAARTRDEELANDLVQDAFLKLASFCRGGGTCAHPKALLYTITTNLVTDHYRRDSASPSSDSGTHPEVDVARAPEPDDRAEADLLTCLGLLVESLPEPYREAVRLADLEDVPQREVARRLGVSVSGAKSRIQRGRSKLRDALLGACSVEHDCYGHVTRCDPRR